VGSLRSLAQQLHQIAVQFVNFLAPVRNVHESGRSSSVMSRWLLVSHANCVAEMTGMPWVGRLFLTND
jgi:hypothetical protein